MNAALVAGLLAGYGIAMPVGAVATYLVALTARTSWRVGACAALGVATADGVYALVCVAGGAALTPVIEPVTHPLQWVSAAVVGGLGVRSAVTAIVRYRSGQAPERAGQRAESALRAYFGLLGITLLNPITVIYFTALVLAGRGTRAPDRWGEAVFVLAAFAASASWQLLLAGGGALLGRVLTGPLGRLGTSLVSTAVLLGLTAHLLVSRS